MKKLFSLLLMCFTCFFIQAQLKDILNGIELGDTTEKVESKLKGFCGHRKMIEVASPNFPLSSKSEKHLIYSRCSFYTDFRLEKIAFTFSDGILSLVVAKGDEIKKMIDSEETNNEFYKNYLFFLDNDNKVVNKKESMTYFLTEVGLHTHLFLWKNPLIEDAEMITYSRSVQLPVFLEFGESLEVQEENIAEKSSFMDIKNFGQDTQINSYGIVFGGFPRKFEIISNNFKGLYKIWILTAKEEELRLTSLLAKEYGVPIYQNSKWTIFDNWRVSLRKDKPEVLILSDSELKAHKDTVMAE